MDPVARWFWSHWLHNCETAPVIERDGEYLSFPYGMFGSGYEVSEDQVTKLNKLVGTINQFTFWLLFVAIPVGVYLTAFLSGLSNNSIIILLIAVVYALTLAFLIYYDTGSHKILKNANMSTYRMTLDDHFSLINRDAPSYLRLFIGLAANSAVGALILAVLIIFFDQLPATIIFSLLAFVVFPVAFTVMLSLYLRHKLQERNSSAIS